MDVSMQSKGRVEKYMNMDIEALKTAIGMKIENPQIFKEFMTTINVDWDYAVAAGILTRADVEYIKEELNSEEPPLEPPLEPIGEGGEGGATAA